MKIIQVPFTFHPDPAGGTEVYVASLARELGSHGVESLVAAPRVGSTSSDYEVDGLSVHRFPVAPVIADLSELYGEGCRTAALGLRELLRRERPDVLHLHAFSRAVSPLAAQAAGKLGVPVVFTYHTPAVSCQRGSLMHNGAEVCDGRLIAGRCAACALQGRGASRLVSAGLGAVPQAVGGWLGERKLSGRVWTGLRSTHLTALRHRTFLSLVDQVDAVVAVSQWVYQLLERNGVPPQKLVLSRQGLTQLPSGAALSAAPTVRAGAPLRLAFFGRLDPLKGLHTLVEAVRRTAHLEVMLDVFAPPAEGEGKAYERSLRALAAGDERIRFRGPVASGDVVTAMAGYHLAAVPSECLETGPLVVLEAFAAGVPVIGSRLGGIAELVRDGVDGVLVRPGSPAAWVEALGGLLREPHRVAEMRARVQPPRTAAAVASDMLSLYQRVSRAGGPTLREVNA
jgi:glycosyltransferase involved in cell wall biosynthesis